MKYVYDGMLWVTEFFLLNSLGLVMPLRFLLPLYQINPHPTKKTPIVIYENWFFQNPYHFLLKLRLERKGYAVYLLNHSLLKGGFEEGAKQIQQFVNERKLHNFVLVGVSMGSLPCLLYFRDHQGWRRTKKVITLGGPLNGTFAVLPIAKLKAAKETLPGSDFFKKCHLEQMPHPEKIMCISAKQDELVPGWSSYLPQVKHLIIDIVGHNNLHIWANQTVSAIDKEAKS